MGSAAVDVATIVKTRYRTASTEFRPTTNPAPTSYRPPSMPSTPTPLHPPKPTGPKSSTSTTSSRALSPSPIIALNRAVALAEVQGPRAALDTLNLPHHYLFHAIRADLLRRLGMNPEAAQAYEAALAYTRNQSERNFLLAQRNTVV